MEFSWNSMFLEMPIEKCLLKTEKICIHVVINYHFILYFIYSLCGLYFWVIKVQLLNHKGIKERYIKLLLYWNSWNSRMKFCDFMGIRKKINVPLSLYGSFLVLNSFKSNIFKGKESILYKYFIKRRLARSYFLGEAALERIKTCPFTENNNCFCLNYWK